MVVGSDASTPEIILEEISAPGRWQDPAVARVVGVEFAGWDRGEARWSAAGGSVGLIQGGEPFLGPEAAWES